MPGSNDSLMNDYSMTQVQKMPNPNDQSNSIVILNETGDIQRLDKTIPDSSVQLIEGDSVVDDNSPDNIGGEQNEQGK